MSPSWTNDRLRKSPHRVLYQLNREAWRLVLVDGFNPFRGVVIPPGEIGGRPPRTEASRRIESLRRPKSGTIFDPNDQQNDDCRCDSSTLRTGYRFFSIQRAKRRKTMLPVRGVPMPPQYLPAEHRKTNFHAAQGCPTGQGRLPETLRSASTIQQPGARRFRSLVCRESRMQPADRCGFARSHGQ